jgi:predicted SAM-dependent methyltransferase
VKLHVGCGGDIKPGWINIDSGVDGPDFCARADLVHDVRKGLPYLDESTTHVYAQHFFEHLDRDEGVAFLRECRRVLVPGGVVRLSMPDLAEFVRMYSKGEIDRFADVGWKPASPARMMNEEFRFWGHKFIYDLDELFLAMMEAGFRLLDLSSHAWGYSGQDELCSLETRPKHWNDLIAEARK